MVNDLQFRSGSDVSVQKEVAAIIKRSSSMVAFTGAGISTSAGISDFRGQKGIYMTGEYPPTIFDIDTFKKNPKIFYTYAKDFVHQEEQFKPTFAHRFLARCEKAGLLQCVITQNIDGLHQKAGNTRVIELHGGYRKSFCTSCNREYSYEQLKEKIAQDWVPLCDNCRGVIKPDIVFFGEPVKGFEEAEQIVSQCDTLLVLGTTLVVYPVAFLPELAKGEVIVINKGEVNVNNEKALLVDSDIDSFLQSVASHL